MRKLKWMALVATVVGVLAVPAVASPTTHRARVGDFFLSPGKLTIRKGTRVTWKWVGALVHNVTVADGPGRFHSRAQVRGTYSHVFRRRGTYLLYCTIHPFMRETIVVK
jgi:plastocyanin